MSEQIILCPHCKKQIPLSEAIERPMREKLALQLEQQIRAKDEEIAREKLALQRKSEEVETARKTVDELVALKLKAGLAKLEHEAKQKAHEQAALELNDLRNQNEEKSRKLQDAQKLELELRKQQRELDEKRQAFELEMTRKLDAERQAIKEQALKSADEAHRLKEQENEKLISDLKKQHDDMKRKLEQGSQQTQGEVLELELESLLINAFPHDLIEPVAKGVNGADVLQKVHTAGGQHCGTIIWESKRTKAWSEGWISKLKEDQRAAKAELAALMSSALPKEINNIGQYSGVWLTNYASTVGLATALRTNLIMLNTAKLANTGKQGKMEELYGYLSGNDFRQRVEAIVEYFTLMQEDLEKEKKAMTLIWSKRQKQIEQVIKNTVGMYGDMQGIMGASLPQIKSLELAPPPETLDFDGGGDK